MVIAINAFNLNNNKAYKDFLYQCFNRISNQYPQNKYIFIFEKTSESFIINSTNILALQVSQPKIFLKNFWLNRKISSILKQYKADIFITTPELVITKTKVLQYLIVHKLIKLLSKKKLSKAKVIWADSDFLKKKIINKYEIDHNKIQVIYKGVDDVLQPIDFKEKEIIKEQYAEGKEYFFVDSAIDTKENLITLLKAFSIFKKRQKSGMQLLFVCKNLPDQKEFNDNLRLYKYKDGVKVLNKLTETKLAKIVASAYAVVSTFYGEGIYLPVLESMKHKVPVITKNNEVTQEVCGDTVLYTNSNTDIAIAGKMMLIFKDENLRMQLIEKGKQQVKKYSWDKSAELLWKSILETNYNAVL